MPSRSAEHIEFKAYQSGFAEETVAMWRLSFQRAMGLPEHNEPEDFNQQLQFFAQIPAANISLAVDRRVTKIAGLLVQAEAEIEQLYIHPDYQGLGLGQGFMAIAKQNSPRGLSLYTFAANTRAQAFYVRQGFVEIGRGVADAEHNPWATDPAQLADIRYQWQPAAG